MVRASKRQVLLQDIKRREEGLPLPDLKRVEARRGMLSDRYEDVPSAPSSRFVDFLGSDYPIPDWLLTEDYTDELLGPIKSGKESQVLLVRRSSGDSSHLLALKMYKNPAHRSFRRDQTYREGRKFRYSRTNKAVEKGTRVGQKAMAEQWTGAEFDALRRLWIAGAGVPYPVEFESSLLMQYLGDEERAAPRLVDARLDRSKAEPVITQILDNVKLMARESLVHADLSAYNILIWEERVWIIDLPQAVDLALNPHAMDFLFRDLFNICSYFRKFGLERDPGEELARIIAEVL